MGDVLKKFGRYFLLDHVAQGGMAEIYRARLASADGAGRLLIIKRVLAGYGANAEFLQMFKSEIKVTMGFNHPNIVQLYDFGEEQGQPYIAMEFVDGRNLRQFMTRFTELKQPFPVELAAYIIEQCAGALHYAHAFKDKISGQPLNIVHRDISPQNILLSYEGNVKVIDFGIAKAASNVESTRAGVIKGKPSYLSPEQISGEVLDGRSDLFALGIVLWEMLCGKKLFAGENDLAVLKLIESCHTHVKPPSAINPKVPKELDYIVLRALAKQREKRFLSGEELQRALHKFLYAYMPEFNPGDLAYYAKDLFKNEIVEDRKRIQRLNDKVEQLLASDTPAPAAASDAAPSGSSGAPQAEEATPTATMVDSGAKRSAPEAQFTAPAKDAKIELEKSPRLASHSRLQNSTNASRLSSPAVPTRSSTVSGRTPASGQVAVDSASSGHIRNIIFGSVAALLALSILGPDMGISVPVISPLLGDLLAGNEARVELQGKDQAVTVEVNGKVMAKSLPATLRGLPVGTSFHVSVSGSSGSFQQDLILKKGEKKVIAVNLPTASRSTASSAEASQVTPGKTILLKLNLAPGSGETTLTVNGRSVDPNNPSLVVSLDSPLELVAERPGYKPLKREFVLDARQMGGLKEWSMDVPMDPVKFGYLTVHSTPSADATIISSDGKPWTTMKTPIDNEKLPVGTYNIKLVNDVIGMEKTISVKIEEGKALRTEDVRLDLQHE